jgi:hypothetical protein
MESPPFTLRGKHMKFRPALLLGGIVLMAAIPVCADSALYTASTNESSNPESSAKTVRSSDTKFVTPATVVVISELQSPIASGWSYATPYVGIAEDSTRAATSARRSEFALALNKPQDNTRSSDFAPAVEPISGFSGGVFNVRASESSSVVGTLFPPSSDAIVHSNTPGRS